jgi:hypothetical protein
MHGSSSSMIGGVPNNWPHHHFHILLTTGDWWWVVDKTLVACSEGQKAAEVMFFTVMIQQRPIIMSLQTKWLWLCRRSKLDLDVIVSRHTHTCMHGPQTYVSWPSPTAPPIFIYLASFLVHQWWYHQFIFVYLWIILCEQIFVYGFGLVGL